MSRNFKLSPIGLAMLAVSGIARAGGYYFRLPVPVPYARQTSDSSATSSTAPTASTTSSSNSGSGGTGSTAPTTSSGSGSGTGGCTGGSVTIQGSTSSAVEQTVSIPDNCTTVEVKMYSAGAPSGLAGPTGYSFSPHLFQGSGPVYLDSSVTSSGGSYTYNPGNVKRSTSLATDTYSVSITKAGTPGIGGAGGNGGNGSELSFSVPVSAYSGGNTSASASISFTAYVAPSSLSAGNGYYTGAMFESSTGSYEGIHLASQGGNGGIGGAAGGIATIGSSSTYPNDTAHVGASYAFNGGGSSNYNGTAGSGGAAGASGSNAGNMTNAQGATFTAGAGGLGGNGLNATSSQVVEGSPGKIVVSWN